MINFYAYTYPSHIELAKERNGLRVKFGDTTREPRVRMNEQGGASESEAKVVIKTWEGIETISRDYQVHNELSKRGHRNLKEMTGKGTEWFCLPKLTIEDAASYLDEVIDYVGGATTSLERVVLRTLQQQKLNQAMVAIDEAVQNGKDVCNILANLCPRFGKTIWALMLFNAITEKYGNRVMILPAYWLSVHSSFREEVETFKEFADIEVVDNKDEDAENQVGVALEENRRVVIQVSLCGEIEAWKTKNKYLADHPNKDIFVFSDEADYGSHTENQLEKMRFLFD